MAQLGTVESVKEKHIFVKVLREEACAHCQVCTTGINEGKECLIEAVNQCDAEVGDIVEIDIQANYFLRATAIMYGIPLIALILGIVLVAAIIGSLNIPQGETITAFGGLIFTAITYLWINKREKRKKNTKYLPIAISKK